MDECGRAEHWMISQGKPMNEQLECTRRAHASIEQINRLAADTELADSRLNVGPTEMFQHNTREGAGQLRIWPLSSRGQELGTENGQTPSTSPCNSAVTGVFDLFVQADPSSRRADAGLGIGLALVRSLVERHGGRVIAASAGPGQGSEFMVRLPTAAE
jgi:light-regulated signal transduction histidine kinase (bacteriophytochrome)